MSVYRGGVGQWSWLLHRVSGVAVLAFLFVHILDTALIILGPEWYNKIIAIYRMPAFGVLEIGLFAALLYHSLNGIRITIIDFCMESIVYYKQMLLVQMVLFALVFLPVAWIMMGHVMKGLHS